MGQLWFWYDLGVGLHSIIEKFWNSLVGLDWNKHGNVLVQFCVLSQLRNLLLGFSFETARIHLKQFETQIKIRFGTIWRQSPNESPIHVIKREQQKKNPKSNLTKHLGHNHQNDIIIKKRCKTIKHKKITRKKSITQKNYILKNGISLRYSWKQTHKQTKKKTQQNKSQSAATTEDNTRVSYGDEIQNVVMIKYHTKKTKKWVQDNVLRDNNNNSKGGFSKKVGFKVNFVFSCRKQKNAGV